MNTQNQCSGIISPATGLFLAQNVSTSARKLTFMSLLQTYHIRQSASDSNTQNRLKSDLHPCKCETQIRYVSSRSSNQLPPELKHFLSLNLSKRRKLPRLIHQQTNFPRNKFVAHSYSNTESEMKMYLRQQGIVS